MKNSLQALSAKLLDIHKELLTIQSHVAEAEDQRKYTPYDLWHLSTQDARFQWLRALSGLIIEIDIAVAEKDPAKQVAPELLLKKVDDLFNGPHADFAKKYQAALLSFPALQPLDAEIQKILRENTGAKLN